MKNKITFTVQWIGGNGNYLSWHNNITGNSGSVPFPLHLVKVAQYMLQHTERIERETSGDSPLPSCT